MTVNVLGQRHIHAHEHCGPDDGVETNDLLTYEVNVCGPIFFIIGIVVTVVEKTECRRIVEERINPYVDDVLVIEVNGNAPFEAGSGYAKVFQTGIDEVMDHFVHTGTGEKEIRVFKKIADTVSILGKTEEICFFFCVDNGSAAVGTATVLELAFGPEAFAGSAVFALIGALIDIAVFIHFFENALNCGNVIIVGGTDETVVADVHQLPKVLNALFALNDVVNELLRRNACLARFVFDLLTVLVRSRQEHNVVALEAFVACHRIGSYGAVGVSDMELVARIIDRSGNIKFVVHLDFYPFIDTFANGQKRYFHYKSQLKTDLPAQ